MAPFCRVNFADFWIADQMNSLAIVFLDLEFFICYMVYGLHVGKYLKDPLPYNVWGGGGCSESHYTHVVGCCCFF